MTRLLFLVCVSFWLGAKAGSEENAFTWIVTVAFITVSMIVLFAIFIRGLAL